MRALYSHRCFGVVGSCGGKKSGFPGEGPMVQGENQHESPPKYGTVTESNSKEIGERGWVERGALAEASAFITVQSLPTFHNCKTSKPGGGGDYT